MKTKVLLLDNYDSFTYNISQILREADVSFDIIKNDNINLGRVNDYDKIIFSPGPGVPDDVRIMSDILEQYGTHKSILGICLGHQAIGHYFGWNVVNLPQPYHGIEQRIFVTRKDEYLFSSIPGEFSGGLYHSWGVEKGPGDELEVTALSSDGVIMALRHRVFDIRGVQFHPESHITKHGALMIRNWVNYAPGNSSFSK